MSAELIALALEVDDDSDSPCDEPTEEETFGGSDVPVHAEHQGVSPDREAREASMQATVQPLVACGEETAMSQQSKGPGKTPASEITPPKKKRKLCSNQAEIIKVRKTTATAKKVTAG